MCVCVCFLVYVYYVCVCVCVCVFLSERDPAIALEAVAPHSLGQRYVTARPWRWVQDYSLSVSVCGCMCVSCTLLEFVSLQL